jgi:hypothetical protein
MRSRRSFGGNAGRFDGVVFGSAGSGFVVLCVVRFRRLGVEMWMGIFRSW